LTAGAALEAEPEVAEALFGSRIDLARQYARSLARQGEELGLIGPLEVPRLWTRHIVNCALVAPLLRPGVVGDIGSGAGLPGLVLAIARPDVGFVLIEPMERRTEWLRAESNRLGLENVIVDRSRSQDSLYAEGLTQLTARAVTSLSKLIPATDHLLAPGGEMVFMKGARIAEEIEAASKAIRKARLRNVESIVLGEGITPEITRVFRARVD
jgi:16S rRNA (guanine527-N7)-methyltransferase